MGVSWWHGDAGGGGTGRGRVVLFVSVALDQACDSADEEHREWMPTRMVLIHADATRGLCLDVAVA